MQSARWASIALQVVTAVYGSAMSLGDPNPSPERDPKHSGASPKRTQLLVRELDPIAIQIPIENLDRLADVLYLCGLTPSNDTVEYLWTTLLLNEIPKIEEIHEREGALGLSLELDLETKHELECRHNLNVDEGNYEERVSVTLSTRQQERNELGALLNLNEGCPALDGLFLELNATPFSEQPVVAHINWDPQSLVETSANERWGLLRGFYHYLKNHEIPESVPLTPDPQGAFHKLSIDLDPMTVRVQRLAQDLGDSLSFPRPPRNYDIHLGNVELRMESPPLEVVELIISMTGALQLEGPWATDNSRREVLDHLLDRLYSLEKLDIDALKVCAGALPCIIFSREDVCNGDIFPPQVFSRVTMTDYTCVGGEFRLEFCANSQNQEVEVACRWYNEHPRFSEISWNRVKEIADPYLLDSSED